MTKNHERLEQRRIREGRTKIGLGRFLGIERTWICDLLDGKACPSLQLAAKIERWTADEPGGPIMAAEWVVETTSETTSEGGAA